MPSLGGDFGATLASVAAETPGWDEPATTEAGAWLAVGCCPATSVAMATANAIPARKRMCAEIVSHSAGACRALHIEAERHIERFRRSARSPTHSVCLTHRRRFAAWATLDSKVPRKTQPCGTGSNNSIAELLAGLGSTAPRSFDGAAALVSCKCAYCAHRTSGRERN